MSVPPWAPGSTEVSIDRCAGRVQDDVLTASSQRIPPRASASRRGVVGLRIAVRADVVAPQGVDGDEDHALRAAVVVEVVNGGIGDAEQHVGGLRDVAGVPIGEAKLELERGLRDPGPRGARSGRFQP